MIGLLAATMLLAFPWSCRKPLDPIQRFLAKLENAAEKRDTDAVLAFTTPEFTGEGGMSRAVTGDELRRYFYLYTGIDVAFTEVTVEKAESSATVRLRVSFSGQPRQLPGIEGLVPRAAAYFFELSLVPRGEEWLVARASWRPADSQ